jgi:hypothetical protein
MTEFCRHLKNGLVYNNNTVSFTVAPCCFYQDTRQFIDPNSNVFQQLEQFRKLWLSKPVEKTCKICIDAELQGLTSYRQASFDTIKGSSSNLEFLTVAVNKKCNLACASCGSNSSSFWYQENQRHRVEEPITIQQMHHEDKQGLIAEKFIAVLAKQDLGSLTYIKFGGGEPLMSDTHEKIMDLIPDPNRVIIQYTSNFSIMPSSQVLDKWSKFKLVKWIASLDGVGQQFELLRWPYRWAKLQDFAQQAIDIVPGNVMFGTEHTVNPLNSYYVDQFEQWFSTNLGSNRYGDRSDFNIHSCTGILGLENTPPALRDKIKRKHGVEHPVSIALDQTPYSGSNRGLVNYMDQLDRWRGTNWRKIFCEVEEFFNG